MQEGEGGVCIPFPFFDYSEGISEHKWNSMKKMESVNGFPVKMTIYSKGTR